MFPYRYMLELHGEERSLRTIAAMTRHSRQKVTEVIRLAEKRGLSLPLDDDMTDPWLEDFLYPEKKVEASGRHRMDFDYIHTELAKPHVTLTLLHEEYLRQAQEEGAIPYAYRTFTEHYHNFARKHKATMRIRRKPGELLEVDWAGTTLFVQDPDSGERIPVYVFVASLPCSQLAYVEGSFSMDLPAWIKLHQNAFAYFNGVPHILVPDNLKTGVTKHTSKELVINKTYAEMARHYGTVVMPARVRSPRDKASVESSVKAVSTWIIAALRSTTCFSLDELNQEIRTKLEAFNHRPFTKKEGSRWSAFLEEEQFALLPMPETRYSLAEWRTAKVQPDYHIAVKGMFYSVPYDYIGYRVEVKVSEESVEIYFNHMRIASHPTLIGTYGQHRTVPEHMPDTHRQYTEQTPQHALEWGASIGTHTRAVIAFLLKHYDVEKQAMKSIFSLQKLARTYSHEEIERACQQVRQVTNRPMVKSIQTMIKHISETETAQALQERKQKANNQHAFIRGAAYFGGKK